MVALRPYATEAIPCVSVGGSPLQLWTHSCAQKGASGHKTSALPQLGACNHYPSLVLWFDVGVVTSATTEQKVSLLSVVVQVWCTYRLQPLGGSLSPPGVLVREWSSPVSTWWNSDCFSLRPSERKTGGQVVPIGVPCRAPPLAIPASKRPKPGGTQSLLHLQVSQDRPRSWDW